MFGIFKNIFRRTRAQQPVVEPRPPEEPSEPIAMPLAPPELSASLPPDLAPAAEPELAPMPAPPDTLSLPIRLVVPGLPDSVRIKANLVGASNVSVFLPLATVLPQLSSGVVTITFDELRKACPPQIFANVSSQEHFALELPLAEILSRVNPTLLKRRPDQKRIEVPSTVTDVFGSKGESVPQPLADEDIVSTGPVTAALPGQPSPDRQVSHPNTSAPATDHRSCGNPRSPRIPVHPAGAAGSP